MKKVIMVILTIIMIYGTYATAKNNVLLVNNYQYASCIKYKDISNNILFGDGHIPFPPNERDPGVVKVENMGTYIKMSQTNFDRSGGYNFNVNLFSKYFTVKFVIEYNRRNSWDDFSVGIRDFGSVVFAYNWIDYRYNKKYHHRVNYSFPTNAIFTIIFKYFYPTMKVSVYKDDTMIYSYSLNIEHKVNNIQAIGVGADLDSSDSYIIIRRIEIQNIPVSRNII